MRIHSRELWFVLGCEYTQQLNLQVMSHPNDVGVSRQYRQPIPDLYPDLDSREGMRGVHRETDMVKFFCECVNSMRMNIERRCAYETD